MKKKIVALLAAIAAVLGFGFATSTAMADPYGSTGTVSGTTVSFDLKGFNPGEVVIVSYDDTYVESAQVTPIDMRTIEAKAGETGGVHVTYTLKAGTPAGTVITATGVGKDSKVKATASVTVETAVGEGTPAAGDQVAQTGASVAPYAVAVVLLAAAGCAVFAARKAGAR